MVVAAAIDPLGSELESCATSMDAPSSPPGLKQHSARATASPPSEQSCALRIKPCVNQSRITVLNRRFPRPDRAKVLGPSFSPQQTLRKREAPRRAIALVCAVRRGAGFGLGWEPMSPPTRMTASPGLLNHCVVMCASVADQSHHSDRRCGSIAPAWLSLYNETFPPVIGVPKARHASAIPSTDSRSCQKFSELIGIAEI